MVKLLLGFFLLALAANMAYGNLQMQCSVTSEGVPVEWTKPTSTHCLDAMKNQIQMEIEASYQYLLMAAHYSRSDINRPGFAEYFFKSAREEREHGSKLIEYLSMRGQLTTDVKTLITPPKTTKFTHNDKEMGTSWKSAVDAIGDALQLETEVTGSIRSLIEKCEKDPNHYHLVDYLTGVFLEEQLHGQRELAGKMSTLSKMNNKHGTLGEFLYDKTLL